MSGIDAPGRMADERNAVAQLKRQCEKALHAAGFSRYDAKAATAIAARIFLGGAHNDSENDNGRSDHSVTRTGESCA